MTYRIRGLDPRPFAALFGQSDAQLADQRAVRMTANANRGFPCRVSLRDADEGDELLLIHHLHHDVATPYRSGFAIFVRKDAGEAAEYIDRCPPAFDGRTIALRGYGADGMLVTARLAEGEAADAAIRELLQDAGIAYIDAHNAAYGCFAARVLRHEA